MAHRGIMIVAAVMWLAVAACNEMPAESSGLAETFETACEEPRPEMCTREYRPVCGLADTGIRCITTPCESTEWRTYGNACTACANKDVFGYQAGECRDDPGR